MLHRPTPPTNLFSETKKFIHAEVDMAAAGPDVAPGMSKGYVYQGSDGMPVFVDCPDGSGVFINKPNDGCQPIPAAGSPNIGTRSGMNAYEPGVYAGYDEINSSGDAVTTWCTKGKAFYENDPAAGCKPYAKGTDQTKPCDPGFTLDPAKGCIPTKEMCSTYGPNSRPAQDITLGSWGCCNEDENLKDGYCICKPGTNRKDPSDPSSPCVSGSISNNKKDKNPVAPTLCGDGEYKDASGKCIKKTNPDKPSSEKTEKSSSGMWWVVGGLALAGVAVGAMYMSNEEKKKDKSKLPANKDKESDSPARGFSTNPTNILGYSHNPMGMPKLLMR